MSKGIQMIRRWPLGALFGILAILAYAALTLASCLQYPAHYNPLIRALSDLGDPLQNPSGAVFYNTGGILLGLLLVPFYLGMHNWNTGSRMLAILITGAQATGIISSAGLVLSCVYPLGKYHLLHGLFVGAAFMASTAFWVFSSFAQLRTPGAVRWMGYFGLLPLLGNIVFFFIPGAGFLSEWISVTFFLAYIALLSYNSSVITARRPSHRQQ